MTVLDPTTPVIATIDLDREAGLVAVEVEQLAAKLVAEWPFPEVVPEEKLLERVAPLPLGPLGEGHVAERGAWG